MDVCSVVILDCKAKSAVVAALAQQEDPSFRPKKVSIFELFILKFL
jgi:hypothetical protein